MTEIETPQRVFNSNDRCDACGAQAWVQVRLASGDLFFCAHHANKHRSVLSDVAQILHDETERLVAEERAGV